MYHNNFDDRELFVHQTFIHGRTEQRIVTYLNCRCGFLRYFAYHILDFLVSLTPLNWLFTRFDATIDNKKGFC